MESSSVGFGFVAADSELSASRFDFDCRSVAKENGQRRWPTLQHVLQLADLTGKRDRLLVGFDADDLRRIDSNTVGKGERFHKANLSFMIVRSRKGARSQRSATIRILKTWSM